MRTGQEHRPQKPRLQKPRPLSRDEVLEMLKKGMGVKEIAQAAGATAGAVRAHLRRLEKEGLVREGRLVEAVAKSSVVVAETAAKPETKPEAVAASVLGTVDLDTVVDALLHALAQAKRVRELESRITELEDELREYQARNAELQKETDAARPVVESQNEKRRRFKEATWH